MTNEAANLLEQLAVLDVEIAARDLLRSFLLAGLGNYVNARKCACGFLPGSSSAKKWDELEKSVSIGSLLEILDFLTESNRTIPELAEALEMHGDLRLALRVLARSTPVAAPRFHPANN